jgi:hypothetical protein
MVNKCQLSNYSKAWQDKIDHGAGNLEMWRANQYKTKLMTLSQHIFVISLQ